jgi:hypothetical protein
MEETFTLLLWELLPEDVFIYVIPNSVITEDQREILENSHKRIINSDEDIEDSLILNDMLAEEKKYCNSEIDEKYHCIWGQYKEECSKPLKDKVITNVYWSGFYI